MYFYIKNVTIYPRFFEFRFCRDFKTGITQDFFCNINLSKNANSQHSYVKLHVSYNFTENIA